MQNLNIDIILIKHNSIKSLIFDDKAAQTSDCLNICRPKNDPCFLELYLEVGLGELLYSVRLKRSTVEVYLAGGDIKDRDSRRYGSSGFYYEFCQIDSSILVVQRSHSYLLAHLKTLDLSF